MQGMGVGSVSDWLALSPLANKQSTGWYNVTPYSVTPK